MMISKEQQIIDGLKKELEGRLAVLKQCLNKPEDRDSIDRQMLNEIQFLERVLEGIDREIQTVLR